MAREVKQWLPAAITGHECTGISSTCLNIYEVHIAEVKGAPADSKAEEMDDLTLCH